MTRFLATQGLAKRLARLSESQQEHYQRDAFLRWTDAWLFRLEDMNADHTTLVDPTNWYRLRELVRVFDPNERRSSITVQDALDLVFSLQEKLFGPDPDEAPPNLEDE